MSTICSSAEVPFLSIVSGSRQLLKRHSCEFAFYREGGRFLLVGGHPSGRSVALKVESGFEGSCRKATYRYASGLLPDYLRSWIDRVYVERHQGA